MSGRQNVPVRSEGVHVRVTAAQSCAVAGFVSCVVWARAGVLAGPQARTLWEGL